MAAPVPIGALQAIEAMPTHSEAQDYAYELYRAFPGKIADLLRAVSHNTWDVHSRKRDEERFASKILEMKGDNCIVCQRNGPIDNLILDSPQTQGYSPCNHFCCTECWEQLAARSEPDAAEIPCPMCRGDVKEYLASQHPEEMQAAPPSAMDTDGAPSGQDDTRAMVDLLENLLEDNTRLRSILGNNIDDILDDNARLREVLRTMRDGVYQNLRDYTVCDVCGDVFDETDVGAYCHQCGDNFCASCAEQYVTRPADESTTPCCAICASNGAYRPYTPWRMLL